MTASLPCPECESPDYRPVAPHPGDAAEMWACDDCGAWCTRPPTPQIEVEIGP